MIVAIDALQGLADLARRMEHRLARRLPLQPRIKVLAATLPDPGDVRAPKGTLIAEIADTLRRIDTGRDWCLLPARTRRYAGWALWTGTPEPIRLPSVLSHCAEEARAMQGTYRLRALIGLYMQDFGYARPQLDQLATAIRDLLVLLPHSQLQSWRERHAEFGIFDPSHGPAAVAEAMLDEASVLALRRAGLESGLLSGGFAAAVHDKLCAAFSRHLLRDREGQSLAHLAAFLEEEGKLRFGGGRGVVLAEALLRPWAADHQPTPALRDAITGFLLRHLRDPRFHPGNWQGLPGHLIDIFLRWLAGATLEEFFELISDRTDNAQWAYRRAFWSAVAHTGAIEDAWVVLNPAGQSAAIRRLGKAIKTGSLSGRDNTGQSVLLLRIGGLVFSEVSHNGVLHAYRADDPRAPRLRLSSYDWADVYAPGLDFPRTGDRNCLWHRNPAGDWWQERAARLLQDFTGLRLRPQDWRP